MSVMKGLTLSTREQTRLTIMNLILDRRYPVKEAANLIGISERHTWRLLAAYRRAGAAALAHKNRGRLPWNAKDPNLLTRVVELVRDRYQGVNHSHLTELLAEREGIEPVDSDAVRAYAQDLKTLLEEADIVQRKSFIKTFVKRIEVDGGKVVVRYKLPLPDEGRGLSETSVLPIETFGGAEGIRTPDPLNANQMLYR